MKMFGENSRRTRRRHLFLLGVFLVFFGCAHKPSVERDIQEAEKRALEDKAISQITVTEDSEESLVSIKGNTALTYTAVKHQFPLGVVLYFPETDLREVQETYTLRSPLIKTIHTSKLNRTTPASRIEIRLIEDAPYEVTREENTVRVAFKRAAGSSARAAAVQEDLTEGSDQQHGPAALEAGAGEEPLAQKAAANASGLSEKPGTANAQATPAVVKSIDFKALGAGKSRLIVRTNRKIDYDSQKTAERRLRLTLHNTKIPEFQRRPLITTRFESAVDRILPMQTEQKPDTSVIAVELRESVPYIVYQEGSTYTVDFEASSVPPRPMPEADRPEWVQAMQEPIKAEMPQSDTGSTVVSAQEPAPTFGAPKRYTGERISLDFQDADIHNIFRILHEVSGKNFVIGDDVKGTVTLKLVNVPWDQVLDLILRMNNLGTVVEGNIVRIATLSTLEAEQRALTKKAQAEQEAKKLEPLITEFIKLDYADAASVKTHLEEVKSERGKITIDKPTNMIIIKDEPEALKDARVLISQLDQANQEIATRQVLIEARIVEADTSFTRDLGVQWGGDYSFDSSWGQGDVFGSGGSTSNVSPNFAIDLPPSSFTSGLGFTFGRIGGTVMNLDIRLLAMEEDGKGRTISSPKVLTLDNKKATIKQITKIPYQVTEEDTTSIETEEAGIELSVTPQITRDNRIRMVIYAEKGAPDWSNTVDGNPAIDTNTAETELFVNDGQTIVIGGILTTTDTVSRTGVPWLSKIPFLGWLFKQKRTVKDKAELLIFITPKIVRLEEAPGIDS